MPHNKMGGGVAAPGPRGAARGFVFFHLAAAGGCGGASPNEAAAFPISCHKLHFKFHASLNSLQKSRFVRLHSLGWDAGVFPLDPGATETDLADTLPMPFQSRPFIKP
jgi:hypothetical protein